MLVCYYFPAGASNVSPFSCQALSTQQANRLASSRAPPLWALLAIVMLGWNEFMAVLWNPVYLILAVAALLFFKTLYSELDVDAEMSKGTLPGLISIAAKFVPVVKRVATVSLDSLMNLSHHATQRLQANVQAGNEASAGATGAGSPTDRISKKKQ